MAKAITELFVRRSNGHCFLLTGDGRGDDWTFAASFPARRTTGLPMSMGSREAGGEFVRPANDRWG